MIVMMDTSHDLEQAGCELGCTVEELLTPHGRHKYRGGRYAIDNGAFAKFNAGYFLALLERQKTHIEQCRWVAVPDVVGSARRTLEVWQHWYRTLRPWNLAFVCQDGQESLPIPWSDCVAVFIGGSTEWKLGIHARHIIKAAQAIGKWIHVGRVNTPGRFEYFEDLGADSIDGTGLARFSHMREQIHEKITRPRLFDGSNSPIREDTDDSTVVSTGV
jgi:hypothetical protein